MYQFVSLRERPDIENAAAQWLCSKWHLLIETYLKCMDAFLERKTEYGWYFCIEGDNIIGGLGVIANDFHDRKDLTPNVCAVYTEEKYRGKGIAGHLLNTVVVDLRKNGVSPVYLVTDQIGFYERYGWEFFV